MTTCSACRVRAVARYRRARSVRRLEAKSQFVKRKPHQFLSLLERAPVCRAGPGELVQVRVPKNASKDEPWLILKKSR